MSLDHESFEEWRKSMGTTRPMFDMPSMSLTQRKTLDALAPDRVPGVEAAMKYLGTRAHIVSSSVFVPAAILVIIAIGVAVIAWAVR